MTRRTIIKPPPTADPHKEQRPAKLHAKLNKARLAEARCAKRLKRANTEFFKHQKLAFHYAKLIVKETPP